MSRRVRPCEWAELNLVIRLKSDLIANNFKGKTVCYLSPSVPKLAYATNKQKRKPFLLYDSSKCKRLHWTPCGDFVKKLAKKILDFSPQRCIILL